MNDRALSRAGLYASILGLALFFYVYIAIIILGDIIYNPLSKGYAQLALSIPFVAYFNSYGLSVQSSVPNLLVGDAIVIIGLLLAFFGCMAYYFFKSRSLTFALGKTVFNYSLLIALLAVVPTGIVSHILGAVYNVPPYKIGLPQWNFSVTFSTCFVKMPGWSIYAPFCSFLNYEEMLVISIITLFAGYLMARFAKPTT